MNWQIRQLEPAIINHAFRVVVVEIGKQFRQVAVGRVGDVALLEIHQKGPVGLTRRAFLRVLAHPFLFTAGTC